MPKDWMASAFGVSRRTVASPGGLSANDFSCSARTAGISSSVFSSASHCETVVRLRA